MENFFRFKEYITFSQQLTRPSGKFAKKTLCLKLIDGLPWLA
jgi:hypothetical protein